MSVSSGCCTWSLSRPIYKSMTRWLVRSKQPIIVIDWSDLKEDRSWHLLRAATPVGGRTLTMLDRVFPAGQQGSPKAEKRFLQRLAEVLAGRIIRHAGTDGNELDIAVAVQPINFAVNLLTMSRCAGDGR